jgi:hypothetical protein
VERRNFLKMIALLALPITETLQRRAKVPTPKPPTTSRWNIDNGSIFTDGEGNQFVRCLDGTTCPLAEIWR